MATAAHAPSRSAVTGKLVLSLLGIVPLGLYVLAHLWTNLHSLLGPEEFDRAFIASRERPAMLLLEIAGLGLPFAVHAWLGLKAIFRSRYNNVQYRGLRNLKFMLQRISALGVLGFVGAHVIKARILPAVEGTHESWQGMHEALSEPITFVVYALGLLGVSYHLGNGLWGASLTFGLAVGPRAQTRMEWVSAFFFVLLLAMSGAALYGFRPFLD